MRNTPATGTHIITPGASKLYKFLLVYTSIVSFVFGIAIFFPAILTAIGFEEGEKTAQEQQQDGLWYEMLTSGWYLSRGCPF